MSSVIDVFIYGGKDYLLGGCETKRRALIGSCGYADTRVDCDVLPYSSYATNLSFIPESDITIKVKSNDWVTDETKFK